MKTDRRLLLILIALAVGLFFFKLGSFSLYNAAETTYGEFIKQIHLTGDWITLHYNGAIIFDKPPLYYWLANACTYILGFNEWAIRLPAAIFGILTVVMSFLLGKEFYNKKVGFLSAIIVMTAFQFLIQSRIAEIDVLLVFFMTAAIYCFWKGKYLPMYLWMALGTLVKGIIAFAIPGFAILLFLLFTKELKKIKELKIIPGVLIILAIGGPWYAAEWILHGAKFTEFVLGFLFLSRFQGVVSGHPGPWYYYFLALLLGFFPWSHFIPYALTRTWKNRLEKPALLMLCFCIPTFIVFSIAKTKLPNYVLPLYPFLAIMVGKLWADFLEQRNLRLNVSVPFSGNRPDESGPVSRKAMLISNLCLAVVVVLVFIAAVIAGSQYTGPYQTMLPHLILLGIVVAGGSLISIVLFLLKHYSASFYTLPVMVFVITFILATQTLPAIENFKGEKELGAKVAAVIKSNEQIAAYNVGNRPGIVFYNAKPVIYLENEKTLANFLKNKKGYCFTTVEEVKRLKSRVRFLQEKSDLVVLY
ncbi:MAG: glycosyltransferase family 39 protein [Candidatus Margulisiibacteriota bacterium]